MQRSLNTEDKYSSALSNPFGRLKGASDRLGRTKNYAAGLREIRPDIQERPIVWELKRKATVAELCLSKNKAIFLRCVEERKTTRNKKCEQFLHN
jgi:hypothetical protein